MKLTSYLRNILWATPLYILTPVPFFILALFLEIKLDFNYVLFGALGWWIALLLRTPVILYLKYKKTNLETSSNLMISFSGPTEEITRLVLLSLIGFNIPNAYSIGLGWGMIEIIYGIIQIIGIGTLEQKTDAKALEAKAFMKQMGMDKTLASSTPFWGALERFSAIAIHIGFSLLLIRSPYIVIFTIPLHNLANFFVVKMNAKSIQKSQLVLLIIGCIILLSSLSLL